MTAAEYGQSLAEMWAARWLIHDIDEVLQENAAS